MGHIDSSNRSMAPNLVGVLQGKGWQQKGSQVTVGLAAESR